MKRGIVMFKQATKIKLTAWLLGLLMATAVVLSACSTTQESSTTSLAEGQVAVYGTVTAIVGNEITIDVGTLANGNSQNGMPGENQGDDADTPATGEGETGMDGSMPQMGGMPDTDDSMPQMDGSMPDMGGERPQMDGSMPDMAGNEAMQGGTSTDASWDMAANAGNMPDMDGSMPDMGSGMQGSGTGSVSLQSTGESATYIVPVDTPVTISGNDSVVTTFSKIAVDNIIYIIMVEETQAIISIEIMG